MTDRADDTISELRTAPGLSGAYGRALLPKRGGGPMPTRRLALRDVAVDPDRLRRYARVCGFPEGDRLPVTYPHIAAFPLAMSLMTRRDFPFPLLGLVHITNRIEQHRPVDVGERLSYEVWARPPFAHARGTAFDVVAEASSGGRLVWRSVSTYLRRGGGSGAPRPTAGDITADLTRPAIDERWEIPGSAGRAYAAVSGDRNPIHLHPLTARLFGFPRAIAHGMWTKARCLAALDEVLPDAYEVRVSFRVPVLLPSGVRLRAARAEAGGWGFELRGADSRREHLRGGVSPRG